MKKLARILVIAVAVFAVPLQGAMAVTAGQCMALEHHHDATHHHDDPAGPHSHVDADDAGAPASHCGPCTACCASATIAGPAALQVHASPVSSVIAFTQQPPVGILPSGLDRPPLAL